VDHHYGRLLGVSAALGLLGGLALGRTTYGPYSSGADLYVQGVASSSANSATQILNRQLNVLPTITIREGHRVQVYLTQDIHLPAYGGTPLKEDNDQTQN
jgi:type IV secretion system protein VirB10